MEPRIPAISMGGPLFQKRHELATKLAEILKPGDILYRASNAKGPLGLPFSQMVGWLSGSPFTHAAMYSGSVLTPSVAGLSELRPGQVYEVNENGTNLMRLVDWIESCYTEQFCVYRLRYWTPEKSLAFMHQIDLALERDVDYDFTFEDPDKTYCTESVYEIYRNCGVELQDKPDTLYSVVGWFTYCLMWLMDKLARRFSKCALPMHGQIFFPGDNLRGMMSSDRTIKVFEYPFFSERLKEQPEDWDNGQDNQSSPSDSGPSAVGGLGTPIWLSGPEFPQLHAFVTF